MNEHDEGSNAAAKMLSEIKEQKKNIFEIVFTFKLYFKLFKINFKFNTVN